MKLLSGLGNLAGALLMTCLGGIAALIKPPAKEPAIQAQRLPHTHPQPIKPLEPKIESPTVTQPLTPTEAEVLAVAETVAAIAHLQPTPNTPIIEPEEPAKAIAQPQPTPSAVEAPTDETPEPEMIDAWAVETKASSGAIAQPITVEEAIAPLESTEPEPAAIVKDTPKAFGSAMPLAIAPTPVATPPTRWLSKAIREASPKELAKTPSDTSDRWLSEAVREASPKELAKTTTLKSRAEQVYAALDAAWSDGTTSYSKLIAAVRETTGRGCSKAKIAAWKKERGLISA